MIEPIDFVFTFRFLYLYGQFTFCNSHFFKPFRVFLKGFLSFIDVATFSRFTWLYSCFFALDYFN